MKRQIRFISSNPLKIEEAKKILNSDGFEINAAHLKIEELQTEDTDNLIRHKTLMAFRKIMRPLFVEHTGLYLDSMNSLPGGLTQIFWDNLGANRFSEMYGKIQNTKALAKTTLGYVDGKRIHIFTGEISGEISPEPKGNKDFQWDCVFIPTGFSETFAEMGDRKNDISMRKRALDNFLGFLKKE